LLSLKLINSGDLYMSIDGDYNDIEQIHTYIWYVVCVCVCVCESLLPELQQWC